MIAISRQVMLVTGIIGIIIFVISIVVLIRFMSKYINATRQLEIPWGPNKLPINWYAIYDDIVQAEIARGNKIEAIKRYRLLTGYGLKESKDAIEYAILHPDERTDKKKKAAYDMQDAGIRDLIQAGRLDEAVEIYQKFAGVDAYTARDAVDEIARDLHLSHQTASRTTFEAPPTNKSSQN